MKPMKLSELINALNADLEANGDTENVSIGIIVKGNDGYSYRLDAVLVMAESGAESVLRDPNYPDGMVCIVTEYLGDQKVT